MPSFPLRRPFRLGSPPLAAAPAHLEHFLAGGTTGKFSTTADVGEWLNSTDNSGTVKIQDSAPDGIAKLAPGTGVADYVSIQMNGESFSCSATRTLVFEARFCLDDSDDGKMFIGFASTAGGTSATAGPVLDGVQSSVGFRITSGASTRLIAVTESATSETVTDTGVDLADGTVTTNFTIVRVEIVNRATVNFYAGSAGSQTVPLLFSHATTIPAANVYVTPTVEISSTTGTTATNMFVDYVYFDGNALQ